jgi:hypothetical protein
MLMGVRRSGDIDVTRRQQGSSRMVYCMIDNAIVSTGIVQS